MVRTLLTFKPYLYILAFAVRYGGHRQHRRGGDRTVNIYKAIFLVCAFIGAVVNLGPILEFSDIIALAMSLPNLLGCCLMSGLIASELSSYMTRLQSGEMLIETSKQPET
ncbi:MAG: alanine:cation symporter family protein, partial [Elainellaceae cyanobacterium]